MRASNASYACSIRRKPPSASTGARWWNWSRLTGAWCLKRKIRSRFTPPNPPRVTRLTSTSCYAPKTKTLPLAISSSADSRCACLGTRPIHVRRTSTQTEFATGNASNNEPGGVMSSARLQTKRSALPYSIIPPIRLIHPPGVPTSKASSIQTFPAWAIGHFQRSRRAPSTTASGSIAALRRGRNWRNGLKNFAALAKIQRAESQMKYFTPDIWAGWQGNQTVFARAQRKWNRNLSRYNAALPGLARKLGQRHGRFFTKHSLHDGRLLSFAVSDWPGFGVKRKWRPVPETRVEMAVLAGG